MQTKSYVEQAKSFLARNAARTALKVVPMALVAVAAAQAQPAFNAPSNNTVTSCSGGSTSGSLTGAVANNANGISLSGNGSLTDTFTGFNCLTLDWKGTGSGTLTGTQLPLLFDYTINTPAGIVNPSWTLSVILTFGDNSQITTNFFCASQLQAAIPEFLRKRAAISGTNTGLPCTGAISGRNFLVATSQGATLAAYEVVLRISANWSSEPVTLSVTVPPASSININAPLGSTTTVPAVSPAVLAIAAIALLTMGMAFTRRWTPTGGMTS